MARAELYGYQKALGPDDIAKLEATETKLTIGLKDKYKVWIKSCVPEDPDAPARVPYWISVTPKSSIDDIFDMVRAREKKMLEDAPVLSDTDDEEALAEREAKAKRAADIADRVPKLIYRGQILEPGKRFGDYGYEKEMWKWSKPFAGVIWISPYHIEPGFAKGRYF